jgi:hypothetical protein
MSIAARLLAVRLRPTIVAAGLLVAALVPSSWGTLLIRLSDEEMGRRADAVVRAEVLDVQSFRDPGRHRVFTNSTLGVLEYLKGSGADQIVVETAGGVIGDLEYRVLGSPQLAVGDEVVLFLEAHGSVNRVIGMAQGKLRVVNDPASGEALLERDLTSVAFVDRDASGRTRVGGHGAPAPRLRLDDLRTLLRSLVPTTGETGALHPLAPAPFSM